jgi:hypothetical protein
MHYVHVLPCEGRVTKNDSGVGLNPLNTMKGDLNHTPQQLEKIMDKFICVSCGNKSFANAKKMGYEEWYVPRHNTFSLELAKACSSCEVGRVYHSSADEVKYFYARRDEL